MSDEDNVLTPPDQIVGMLRKAVTRLEGGGSLPGNKELTEYVYPVLLKMADHLGELWGALDDLNDVEGSKRTLEVIKLLVDKAGPLDEETQEKVAEVTAYLAERIVSAGADEGQPS